MLSPEKANKLSIERTPLAHSAFLWEHNQDAMAVEKLSDGIRRFDADARKLERAIGGLMAGRAAA
jgi:transaldolase